MLLEVVITIIAMWFVYWFGKTYQQRKYGPPGPFPLPVIGNLHQLGANPPFTLDPLWKKFGDVYQITFPVGTFVIINSAKAARETLVTRKDDFAGRPTELMFPIDVILEGKNLGNGDYGPSLLFKRKVLKTALHVFGEGMQNATKRVERAMIDLLKQTENKKGEAFYIQNYISAAIASQLWEWLTSKKTNFDEGSLLEVIAFNENVTCLARQGNYYQMLPLLTYLPTAFGKKLKDTLQMRDKIYARELEEHRLSYVEGSMRDVTDALITSYHAEKAKHLNLEIGPIQDLKFLMIDVLLAGADTSRTVVSWCVFFLVLRKELQDELQQEIDEKDGGEHYLSWKDIRSLPKLQSFVCEVLRYTAIFPWMPHKALRDTTLNGYHIAKNTAVFINFYRIHRDPSEWDEPQVFKPHRFLDSDGKFVGWMANKGFLPFGIGRRFCLGQELGKMQVFLMVANLLHQFTLGLPPEDPIPSILDSKNTFVHQPPSHRVTAIKRR